MESLESFNARRMQEHISQFCVSETTKLNGIACPKCGNEMFDSSPMATLMSYPPQKEVGCQCGYKGYRIA